ncbi:LysE family translocator [Conexibacter sp. SYSU D00693]|uniref:LysE family translocator n=1 Tax=Conexibacter sp. SYSU D00693 TaxID=2812560 RepID=UPI00196A5011|nr:LysE family transporter [Conexibacter sp. SYSU D00693]
MRAARPRLKLPDRMSSDVLHALGSGLLAGWAVAVPLGAMGVLLVDLAARHGVRAAAPAALGVATADLAYATVAAAAGLAVNDALDPVRDEARWVSAGVLAAMALVLLVLATRPAPERHDGLAPRPATTFARFLGLTAVNPTTAATFAALIAGLPAVSTAGADAKAVFVAAVFLASASWQLLLVAAGGVLHHRLPAQTRPLTAGLGAILVLALAVRTALG